MKLKNLLITFLAALTVAACQEENLPTLSLPDATQTGQNTLGFLLNEKVWANYGRRCTIAGCEDNQVQALLYRQPGGNLEMGVSAAYTVSVDTADQAFYISAVDITSTGNFPLSDNPERNMTFVASKYAHSYREYKNLRSGCCVLHISRFDTVGLVLAGTFDGILHNPADLRDSVIIRDGRFDATLDFRP